MAAVTICDRPAGGRIVLEPRLWYGDGWGRARGLANINTNTCEVIRPLTSADVALLSVPEPTKPPQLLKKIRDSHHKLAAMIAAGCSLKEISEATGYSYSRVSILKSDPTFEQLVEFYREKAIQANVEMVTDLHGRLTAFLLDVVEEMHDRLQTTPENVNNDTLRDWGEFAADRVGHGKQSKSLNASVDLNDLADQLSARRHRAEKLSAGVPPAKPARLDPPRPAGQAAPKPEGTD